MWKHCRGLERRVASERHMAWGQRESVQHMESEHRCPSVGLGLIPKSQVCLLLTARRKDEQVFCRHRDWASCRPYQLLVFDLHLQNQVLESGRRPLTSQESCHPQHLDQEFDHLNRSRVRVFDRQSLLLRERESCLPRMRPANSIESFRSSFVLTAEAYGFGVCPNRAPGVAPPYAG